MAKKLSVRALKKAIQGNAVVAFVAPWCGYCKTLGPELDAVAQAMGSDVRVAKVDYEKHGGEIKASAVGLAEVGEAVSDAVAGYPTIMMFGKGGRTATYNGARTAPAIKTAMAAFFNPANPAMRGGGGAPGDDPGEGGGGTGGEAGGSGTPFYTPNDDDELPFETEFDTEFSNDDGESKKARTSKKMHDQVETIRGALKGMDDQINLFTKIIAETKQSHDTTAAETAAAHKEEVAATAEAHKAAIAQIQSEHTTQFETHTTAVDDANMLNDTKWKSARAALLAVQESATTSKTGQTGLEEALARLSTALKSDSVE